MVGRVSGVVNRRTRAGVNLLLSKRVLAGEVEYREISAKLMWVKAKFGGEVWVFVSAYGPGCKRSEEEREALHTGSLLGNLQDSM